MTVLASLLVAGDPVLRLQVAVSDFLFLGDGGPHLGRLPASKRIVLVLYDDTSRREMQSLPTLDDDLALYRQLLDAGAKIIADTRMIADGGGDEAADVRRFLGRLVDTHAQGRLFRDVWMAGQLPEEFRDSVEPFIANNVLNMHPNADSFFAARIYPLTMTLGDRFRESLPLVVARTALGLPRWSSADVIQQVKGCGISAAWQKSLPKKTALRQDLRADDIQPRDYPLGDRRVLWHLFPSKSPSVLPVGYWISYAWPPTEFVRVSYITARHEAARETFADKIVLIGYDAASDPTSDTYPVPSQRQPASASEMTACAIETLLAPRLTRPAPFAVGLISVLGLSTLAGLAGGLVKPVRAAGALLAIWALWLVGSVAAQRAGWFVDLALTPTGVGLAGVLGMGHRSLRETRWRHRIVDLFGRYVPRAVVTQLVQQPDAEALALGGVRRDVTVLFADIRGFTPFAERIPPEAVIEQLNSLLRILVDCTFAHEGTVDKFIGDAILVLFNAPLDQRDHVQRAARTALAMQQGIARHPSGLTVGIGIHWGEAVVGRVGTPERMEYTAVGSTVNVASRLCSAAASGTVVVSDTVASALAGSGFQLVAQPPLQVKGVAGELQTFLLQELEGNPETIRRACDPCEAQGN
jgi:adenylate cyclase